MKNLSTIDTGAQTMPLSGAGRPSLSDPELRPRSEDLIETKSPDRAEVNEESASHYEEAVKQLQESLDLGSGPKRDVSLEFLEGNFIVEVRRHEDGVLIQRFPPENLLNYKDRAADHLGMVIDRQV